MVPGLLVLVAIGLLPWTLWLSLTLPSHHVARHWDLAWAGFDLLLSGSLVTTGVGLARGHPLVQAAAAASAALLIADAWFDTVTARPGDDFTQALALAVAGELPLAALCLWIASGSRRSAQLCARIRFTRLTSGDPTSRPTPGA